MGVAVVSYIFAVLAVAAYSGRVAYSALKGLTAPRTPVARAVYIRRRRRRR